MAISRSSLPSGPSSASYTGNPPALRPAGSVRRQVSLGSGQLRTAATACGASS